MLEARLTVEPGAVSTERVRGFDIFVINDQLRLYRLCYARWADTTPLFSQNHTLHPASPFPYGALT